MHHRPGSSSVPELPPLRELGPDLQTVTTGQRWRALVLPFFWCGTYFALAAQGWWGPASFALVALSFVTYGSTSHDLVHCNLGLSSGLNDILLSVIELLGVRSGHAYQAAHLHHHARYPHPEDIESLAARRSLLGALAEGFVFQLRIYLWALKNADHSRKWIIGEGIACVVLMGLAMLSPLLRVYVVLMMMGSWIIPLLTSYLPHDPSATHELFQTRALRGRVASVVMVEHLYHLEHHLYPSVPHCNWPALAERLDPYLERAGVKPIRFWR